MKTRKVLSGKVSKTFDDLNLKQENESEFERNERFQKQYGNCYKLIELIKKQRLQLNPYMSPLFCDESIIDQMPKTYLIVNSFYFNLLLNPIVSSNLNLIFNRHAMTPF